ncbi:MAG: phosphatidylserine decarboxylase family protein [Marinilabiliaceae bacterium]|nr:phosphatidylserine decarboxylase family protein [Marinilabiliaceae bacterium]
MKLHKEGNGTITVVVLFLLIVNSAVYYFSGSTTALTVSLVASLPLLLIVLNFFRFPKIEPMHNDRAVISPADGKVVVIEEVEETEYLKTRCIQVSVFMSPLNVHINWFPINGIVKYFRHHNGRFQAAYLPKSSTENERTTVVLEHKNGKQILVRQVAGALARRIVCYANEGDMAKQSEQMGFIKFGSRLDIYFPLGSRIDVKLDQKVNGRQTILGWLE